MQNLTEWCGLVILGWCVGALVNYLSDVLPWKRRFAAPLCVLCQESIPWKNYFFWPRRCQACGRSRPWRVWVVEGVYILSTLFLWEIPPNYLGFWVGLILLAYFGIVVVVDIEYRLILHQVSLVGAMLTFVVGSAWRALRYAEQPGLLNVSLDAWWHGIWTTLAGGALGFFMMWLLYLFGEIFVRFMARRRGQPVDEVALGFGDVNLAGVLGLLLGWPLVVAGLFSAILIAGLVSLLYMLVMLLTRRYHVFMALPYGPFLVFGAVFVIYFRELLLQIIQSI